VLVTSLVGGQTGFRHAPRLDQPRDVSDVDPAPDALRLSRAEADRKAVVVEPVAHAVNPAETEGFVERLRVGEAAVGGMCFEGADEKLGRAFVVLLQPGAKCGLVPEGRRRGGWHAGQYSRS